MDNKNIHHGKILGKLLLEKEISKGEFCKLMGYSPKNYTTNFYKEKLAEKVLEKIGEVLSVDLSIFQNEMQESPQTNKGNIVNGNGNGFVTQNVASNDLYERLLKEKDNQIEMLKQQVADLKKRMEN
jgi:translation initiation factor 6 (eIF-6)